MCHKERDKLRALIRSHNGGAEGNATAIRRRGHSDRGRVGRRKSGEGATKGAAGGQEQKRGQGEKGGNEREGNGCGRGYCKGRGRSGGRAPPEAPQHGQAQQLEDGGFIPVGLVPSPCYSASHVVVGLVPRQYYVLIMDRPLMLSPPTTRAGACRTLPGPTLARRHGYPRRGGGGGGWRWSMEDGAGGGPPRPVRNGNGAGATGHDPHPPRRAAPASPLLTQAAGIAPFDPHLHLPLPLIRPSPSQASAATYMTS